jgi:hypothetical protein
MTMRLPRSSIASAVLLCTAVAAAGCAAPVPATESQRHIVDIDGDVYRSTDQGISASFTAPRADVWKALLGAYDDMGISAEATDTTIWAVSRKKLVMRNVYKGTRTSRLFSCGETATGSAQADVGQIIANVRSQVTPTGSGTRVATLVDAWVIPDGGTSSNALHCGSTGLLEAQLHKAIATRLGQLAPGE